SSAEVRGNVRRRLADWPRSGPAPRVGAAGVSPLPESPVARFAEARALVADATAPMLELVVKPGDTLERLFRRHGLSLTDLASIAKLKDVAEHIKLLRPGDTIRVAHRDGQVLSLLREIDRFRMLAIQRVESGFDAKTIDLPIEI